MLKPKMVFSVLYDEMLPSNKNNNRLVNNLNIISDITKIIPMQKDMIIVGLIETYLEMKNDKST